MPVNKPHLDPGIYDSKWRMEDKVYDAVQGKYTDSPLLSSSLDRRDYFKIGVAYHNKRTHTK